MKILEPGAVLGVLGSGQLGRMFAEAAKGLGYKAYVYSPEANSPAGQVADKEIVAEYLDLKSLEAFAKEVDAITIEFENVPAEALEHVAQFVQVSPAPNALKIAQNRIAEKTCMQDAGIPVTPFIPLRSAEEIEQAETFSFPAVLKTASTGYDGKGQQKIDSFSSLTGAWNKLHGVDCVLESFIDFEKEISFVAARSADGSTAVYPPFENVHTNHILDVTVCPAQVEQSTLELGQAYVEKALEALEYIGVICFEFFVLKDGSLLFNEFAPRPHNSGHLTIDAFEASQFEQQVISMCGIAPGNPGLKKPAAMVNLLGELWENGEPAFENLSNLPNTTLHLYGKHEARAGRKMGHIVSIADDPESAKQSAIKARDSLQLHL